MTDQLVALYRDEPPANLPALIADLHAQVAELNEALEGALHEAERRRLFYALAIDGQPLAAKTSFSDAIIWRDIVGSKFPKSQIKVVAV